jgi:hypothetical protein
MVSVSYNLKRLFTLKNPAAAAKISNPDLLSAERLCR